MAQISSIDRERALVTARSIVANIDVLGDEGLDSAGQSTVIEVAERLAEAVSGSEGTDYAHAAALARQLRDVLAPLSGRSAGILVNWLDDLLDPQG